MALFGDKFEPGTEGPSIDSREALFGGTVDAPEAVGGLPRRNRLYHEAERLAASGFQVRSRFEQAMLPEAAMIKWVSLRGALLSVQMNTEGSMTIDEFAGQADGEPPDGWLGLAKRYGQIAELSFTQVLGEPTLVRDNHWHLDAIAWTALASVKADNLFHMPIPRAARLSTPGWYAEPVFAKAERYWDGGDWTSRCRLKEGRTYRALAQPI